jgi:predicted neutral ceramidase superfamily lipid hydrolase
MANTLELKLRFRELLANAKESFLMALSTLVAASFYFSIFGEKALSNSAFMLLLAFSYIAFFAGLKSLGEAVMLLRFSGKGGGSSHA